jgi:LysM repeat protein
MAHRSPARFLAPLALVAFCFALFMIVTSTQTSSDSNGSPSSGGEESDARPTATATPERRGRRRYTVQEGDTPSSIAEETGVPLEDILRLNPDLDPQTLRPGQRIRLRQ